VDGSSHTGSVTEHAMWLSRGFGAPITGLYVIDIKVLEGPFLHDVSGTLGFEPFLNFSKKVKEGLETRGKDILSILEDACAKGGAECSTTMSYGIVPSEICEKAKAADIVVIGKRGVNAQFSGDMMGSVTEAVIRRSPAFVFAVPEDFKPPAKPLLCYDGSANAAKAMRAAAETSKFFKLPLTVVASMPADGAANALKEAEDYIKPYAIEAEYVALAEGGAIEIEKHYKLKGHDLVFLGASSHTGILKLVLGSFAEHLMRSLRGPFCLAR